MEKYDLDRNGIQQGFKLDRVSIRLVEEPPLLSQEPMIHPEAAIRVLQEFLKDMDREMFCIVNLQSNLCPINMSVVSVGSLNQSLVHPRELLKSVILSNAASMIMIHNHPSGKLEPSKDDIMVTERMQQIGSLIGIEVLDHIITGRGKDYYSFKENKILSVPELEVKEDIHKISFFAAEYMAVPVLGAFYDHLSIEQALEQYEKMPGFGQKGIGFDLKDGSDYEGKVPLLIGGEIQRASINAVSHYRNNPFVQKALEHVEHYIDKRNRIAVCSGTHKTQHNSRNKQNQKEEINV